MPESPEIRDFAANRRAWLYARAVWIPTLCWNILLGRVLKQRDWWNAVDAHVLIGALPFPRDVPALAKLGVTGVVNTCEEYQGPQAAYSQAGIEQLRVPTIDFTAPSLPSVRAGVEFVERHVANGGRVYVHCKAGRGRSATVVMGWLMKHNQMTPEEAQRHLLEVRGHVNRHLAERQVVRDFYAELASGHPTPDTRHPTPDT